MKLELIRAWKRKSVGYTFEAPDGSANLLIRRRVARPHIDTDPDDVVTPFAKDELIARQTIRDGSTPFTETAELDPGTENMIGTATFKKRRRRA